MALGLQALRGLADALTGVARAGEVTCLLLQGTDLVVDARDVAEDVGSGSPGAGGFCGARLWYPEVKGDPRCSGPGPLPIRSILRAILGEGVEPLCIYNCAFWNKVDFTSVAHYSVNTVGIGLLLHVCCTDLRVRSPTQVNR